MRFCDCGPNEADLKNAGVQELLTPLKTQYILQPLDGARLGKVSIQLVTGE